MRNEIKLTDEQIEEIFAANGYHLVVDEMVFTRDEIADFEKKAGRNPRKSSTEGFNTFESSNGFVVDFGTVRVFGS